MKSKNLLLLICLIFSSMQFSFAQDISFSYFKAQELLNEKNISIESVFQNDPNINLGEVSGAGFMLPYENIMIMFTENEAILKEEILGTQFGQRRVLGDLKSIRLQNGIVTKKQLKGLIYYKK